MVGERQAGAAMSVIDDQLPPAAKIVGDAAMDRIFRQARTHRSWNGDPVSDVVLAAVYELARMPPTSANCSPMRVLFLKSKEAKERLRPVLSEGNVKQTMAAPVTAVIAYDTQFYELLPRLWPFADARKWFAGKEALIKENARCNGSLKAPYLIRRPGAGPDCGPMSGFRQCQAGCEFFPDGRWKSNFLCNLGMATART
jgi:3-hydroxypropanoate dehydrogenase